MNTIITRGLGDRQRLVTQGYGAFLDFEARRLRQEFNKTFDYIIEADILVSNKIDMNIVGSVEFSVDFTKRAHGKILIENNLEFPIKARINNKGILRILDAI
jgi:hypothetical protein